MEAAGCEGVRDGERARGCLETALMKQCVVQIISVAEIMNTIFNIVVIESSFG